MAKYDIKKIEAVRKDYCEICGSPAYGWPHHIKTRGAGGKEDAWNLIQLCGKCHELAQQYKIPRLEVVKIVAKREGISVEEIYKKNNWLYEGKLPHEVTIANPIAGKTFEEVLELYFYCLEKGTNSMWERAALITVMHDYMKLSPKQIASAIGCSASLCRKMVKTYNTFPLEETRIPFLTFRHHQIAAYTSEPIKWLEKAADSQWSTRAMQEAINNTQESEEEKEEKAWAKAEKLLLLVTEMVQEGSDVSAWLKEELAKLNQLPTTFTAIKEKAAQLSAG